MANPCYNTVTIEPITTEAKTHWPKLLEALKRKTWFQLILPCPPQLDAGDVYSHGGVDAESKDAIRALNLEKYGFEDGLNWRWETWGCMRDASGIEAIYLEESQIQLTFETPWNPPIGVYRQMYELGYSLNASWCEEGFCILGGLVAIPGKGFYVN